MYSLRNDRDNEWILESCVLEVLRSVIEDEVNASKLLQSLETAASQQTLANCALEAVDVSGLCDTHFIAVIGFDFAKLFYQLWVRYIEASESAKCFGSLIVFVLFDQESWRFGQEQKTDTNDDGPRELDSYWDLKQ
jgi:hypothetical protein